jgi:histidinol phosphatase-like PHP family hydrolase
MKYNVRVVVSTDAHYMEEVGEFGHSLECLRISDFRGLILNADTGRLRSYFKQTKGIDI